MPGGFFLKDLTYVPFMSSPGERVFTEFQGIGGTDYRGAGRWDSNYGATQISGFFTNNRFFEDTPDPVSPSSRHAVGFNIRQALTKSVSLAFGYRDDIQQNNYDAPNPGENQDTQYQDAIASGKLGNGFLKLSVADLKFTDNTGTLLSSNTQTMGAGYLWTPIGALDIQADYTHASIGQAGMLGSNIDTLSLRGDLSIGSGTDINLAFVNRDIGMPNVQNAYVRHEAMGTMAITQQYKSWRGYIGLKLQDDDRVDAAQTYVDVPKWSTLEGRISGRILGENRLTIRGYTQSLYDPPTFSTMDPTNLYYTSRNFVEARLEGGHDELTYYLVYNFQDYRDASRDTDIQTSQYTVGAIWQMANSLNVFGEYHHEGWSGYSGGISGYPNIGDFLPTTDTGTVQIIYNANKRTYFSVNYSGFGTRNNNPLLLPDGNTAGSFVTINGHYRFPRGYELGFMVAPWTYHDNVVSALNYNATVLMLTGSARF